MVAFVDSAVWIGSIFDEDPSHKAAKGLLSGRTDLCTSNFVIDEVVSFFMGSRRHGLPRLERKKRAIDFLDIVQKSTDVQVITITGDHFSSAKLEAEKHPLGLTITDWTNVIVMKELGIAQLLTFDKEFRKVKRIPGYEFLQVRSKR
jgi:predicted nucleic acid-binding protein